jgi:membrane protease YdiL (CAAX protease family)
VRIAERVLLSSAACLALLWAAPFARERVGGSAGLALQALASAAFFVVLAFGAASLPPGPPGAAARLGLGRGRLAGWAMALLCVGLLALSNALESAIRLLGRKGEGALGTMERTLEGTRGPELAFALLAIAVGSAVSEEIFFRGLIQRGLARVLGRGALRRAAPALAIGAASLLFAAAHGDRIHGTAAFFLGLYLGAVTWLADSVRTSALCHVLNNTAAVLGASFAAGVDAPPGTLLAVNAGVAGGALALAWRFGRRPAPAPDPPLPSTSTYSAEPGRPTQEP